MAAWVPTAGEQFTNEPGRVARYSALRHVPEREGTVKFARRRFLHLAVGAAALPAASSIARSQTYPSRSITIVVPFAVGEGAFVRGGTGSTPGVA
jgi:hypothetical protein